MIGFLKTKEKYYAYLSLSELEVPILCLDGPRSKSGLFSAESHSSKIIKYRPKKSLHLEVIAVRTTAVILSDSRNGMLEQPGV